MTYKVTIYRDGSETSVVYQNVKHAFMTCGDSVLCIAQLIPRKAVIEYELKEEKVRPSGNPEQRHIIMNGPDHHYINWPRERIAWWKVEREIVDGCHGP